MQRFWLSFVVAGTQAGVAVVDAENFLAAVVKTHQLGINPGGEVAGWEAPVNDETTTMLNKLTSRADLVRAGYKNLRELTKEGRELN